MAEESIEKQLQILFPTSTVDVWKKIAMLESGGKDPFENLRWRGKDDLLFLPYYDSDDTADLRYLDGVLTAAASAQHKRSWLNLPAVIVTNEDVANKLALEHLAQGANGVIFDLRNCHRTDFKVLTKKIPGSSCIVFFRGMNQEHLDAVTQHVNEESIPSTILGALFWESVPKIRNGAADLIANRNIRALGITIKPSSPAHEVAQALSDAVKTIENFSDHDPGHKLFDAMSFSMPADTCFLETAAKIKALRFLWFQVAQAYGHTDYKLPDVHIHVRSEQFVDERYSPHENMLKATFASMAAIAGGCDSLTIEDETDAPLFRRWSRNVSNILREESFFDVVADPLAGAYAPDVMTDAIAKKAWAMFQQAARL